MPHSARRYDYWLGGKDNFAADRASGDAVAREFPTIRLAVLENRNFMRRVVHHLAAERGIRQFLDIGTGIPTSPNLHEVAQAVAPDSRIVYVDNDPVVMVHSRALLTSDPRGAMAYLEADLRDPQAILAAPALRATLDLGQPVALLLIAVLHFLTDDDDPYGVVARLVAALPRGSFVVLSHVDETLNRFNAAAGSQHGAFRARTRDEVGRFLDRPGLELLAPGIVSIIDWLPDQEPKPTTSATDTAAYGAVARLARTPQPAPGPPGLNRAVFTTGNHGGHGGRRVASAATGGRARQTFQAVAQKAAVHHMPLVKENTVTDVAAKHDRAVGALQARRR